MEGIKKLNPNDILKDFFNSEEKLFVDIEMVMQAMAVSAIKHSVESVLESFVSIFENHFDSRRNLDEDSTVEEFAIAVNGPNIARCDSVVKEVMSNYWASKGSPWHFFKTSVLEKLKITETSQVLQRHLTTKSNLPFME